MARLVKGLAIFGLLLGFFSVQKYGGNGYDLDNKHQNTEEQAIVVHELKLLIKVDYTSRGLKL